MPEIGWIIFAAVLVGPVLLGLLLHRFGFSRAVSVGLGSTIVAAALLLTREPTITPSAERTSAIPAETASSGARAETEELHELRRQVSALLAERRQTQSQTSGDSAAALSRETASHKETTIALKATREKLEASIEAQRRLAAELETARRAQPASTELEDTRRRLAIAEATIARLEAAARAAPPRTPTADPPFAPAPFSATRSELPAKADPPAANVSTGATDPPKDTKADNGSPLAPALSEPSRARQFELTKIDNSELVEGRRGSYYRITCPDAAGGNRLKFEADGYQLDGGEQALASCLEAIRKLILSPLPPAAAPRLYVQAFASTQGTQRPRRLASRDPSLRAITFLPRKSGAERYATRARRSNIGESYANTDLPNLRAAFVAGSIVRATRNAIRPEILEGQLMPATSPSSRSFDLILQTAW